MCPYVKMPISGSVQLRSQRRRGQWSDIPTAASAKQSKCPNIIYELSVGKLHLIWDLNEEDWFRPFGVEDLQRYNQIK